MNLWLSREEKQCEMMAAAGRRQCYESSEWAVAHIDRCVLLYRANHPLSIIENYNNNNTQSHQNRVSFYTNSCSYRTKQSKCFAAEAGLVGISQKIACHQSISSICMQCQSEIPPFPSIIVVCWSSHCGASLKFSFGAIKMIRRCLISFWRRICYRIFCILCDNDRADRVLYACSCCKR